MRIYIVALLVIALILSCNQTDCPEENETSEPIEKAVNTSDIETMAIKKTIDGLYANIRVENGQLPNTADILVYFSSAAQMGSVKNDSASLGSPTDYFKGWEIMMKKYQPNLLIEGEIKGRTQHFGNIAYHTSHYYAAINHPDSIVDQGIINYQLVRENGNWKVASMIWESEKEELTVPKTYFD